MPAFSDNFGSHKRPGSVIRMWFRSSLGTLLKRDPHGGRQIASLDGLRGIAVFFVLLSHLSNAGADLLPFLSFSGIGKVGVWLFFVLSAFLLSLQFLEKTDAQLRKPGLWRDYFVRRFLRIYPLFVFIMVVSYLLRDSGFFPPLAAPDSLADLANRLTLRDAKGVEWSILVEFRFYFVLPVLMALVIFVFRRSVAATFSAFMLAIALVIAYAPPPSMVEMLPYLSVFLVGCATAFAYWLAKPLRESLPRGFRVLSEAIAVISFITILILTPSIYSVLVGHEIPLDHFHSTLTPFAVLWGIFLFAYLHGTGHIERILSSSLLRYAGVISFGLYLWHPPVLNVIALHLPIYPSFQALSVFIITSALASLTFFFIEKPFLRIRAPLRFAWPRPASSQRKKAAD
jgi:peptidoglycan/LPS O-acetylase OafA/YrhL